MSDFDPPPSASPPPNRTLFLDLLFGFLMLALAASVAIFMIIPAIRGLQQAEPEPRKRGRGEAPEVVMPDIKIDMPKPKFEPPVAAAERPAAPAAISPTTQPPGISTNQIAPYEGTLVVTLASQAGMSPTGWTTQPGWPYKLTRAKPAHVTKPPPEDELLYGEVPLAHAPVWFAMTVPKKKSTAALFYVDKNRDGDFTNDGEAKRGMGDFQSAYNGELPARTSAGEAFPYYVWLWTSINHPQQDKQSGEHGFNFYNTTVRRGAFDLALDGGIQTVAVLAGDPRNNAAFDSGKIVLDWNGNGTAEDPEWLKEGEACRHGSRGVRLKKIGPSASAVMLEFVHGDFLRNTPDVARALTAEPVTGNPPPELGRDVEGNTISWNTYRGKVVLVDFWATWCGPCIKEMPNVKMAHLKYHPQGFEIIGVSLDKNIGKLREYLEQQAIGWPQICEAKSWESEIAKRWRVRSIPATFLIGRNGKIAATGLRGEMLTNAIEQELAK